jgi:hypothetical protein
MNNTKSHHFAQLNELDLIRVSGVDSQHFLQNQLTSDINELVPNAGPNLIDQATLSGYCTPQGRMTASFWISRSEISGVDTFNIWISRDIAEKFSKKLKMFVLRSKVTIEHSANKYVIFGAWGNFADLENPLKREQNVAASEISSVTYENQVHHRYLFAMAKNEASDQLDKTSLKDLLFWRFLEVMSGIPRITEATQDKFIPQMINFESLHGIAFQKGCYPGQEIIARTQYRGTIKRRLFVYSISIAGALHLPQPGDEVYDANDLSQPAGMVVLSGFNADTTKFLFQVELKIESSNHPLSIKKDEVFIPLSLELEKLPYTLLNI